MQTTGSDISLPRYTDIFPSISEGCIYNGIYVGENSPIPNTDGIRNDIIEALRNIKAPVFRWPGGLLCRRISLAGRYRRKISAPKDREHELGRSYGG